MKRHLLITTSLVPLLATGILGASPASAGCAITGATTGISCVGGSISSGNASLGEGAGNSGSVSLSGAGASWTDTGEVSVRP